MCGRKKYFDKVSLAALIFVSSPVAALRIEPGIGAGIEYTDNVRLSSENEESDWIATGYVGAQVDHGEGAFTAHATTSLSYQKYLDNGFGDKYYYKLAGTARWEQIRDRLDWHAQNFFTQRLINPDANVTQDNIENTNVFSFGPSLMFPVTDRQTVTIRPLFTDYYYESNKINNRRYALNGSWSYQVRPAVVLSTTAGVTKVSFEKGDQNPDYVITNLMVGASVQHVHSDFSVNAGVNRYNRDEVESQTGFTGNATFSYNLASTSKLKAYASTQLTDTSRALRNASTRPDEGDFSDVQTSNDVLRDSILRLSYERTDSSLRSSLWGYVRDLDYKEQPEDREVRSAGLDLSYDITPLLSGSIHGESRRTDRKDTNVVDKRYVAGVGVSYKLSRQLRAAFDVRYRKKSSDNRFSEYTETSAFASIVWGFGSVPRPNVGRGN